MRLTLYIRSAEESAVTKRRGAARSSGTLLSETNGLRWAKAKGEMDLLLLTEFCDFFALGVIGVVNAHLRRTIGDERTDAKFVMSVAIVMYCRRSVDAERENTLVEFN